MNVVGVLAFHRLECRVGRVEKADDEAGGSVRSSKVDLRLIESDLVGSKSG